MTTNQKGAIAVGLTLGLVGLAYYFFVHSKQTSGNMGVNAGSENLEALKKNLGAGKYEKDVATVPFNDQKNYASFYSNNRVIIFDANKKVIMRGNYSDGGKQISIEKGKQVSDDSVWTNLAMLVK